MGRILPMLAAVLLVSLSASFAQGGKKGDQNTRSVQGVVSAADDAPVANAVVQLEDTKSKQVRSFITQADGSYYFQGLNPDIDYELKAKYQDVSSPTKTLSSYDSRKKAIINLKLSARK